MDCGPERVHRAVDRPVDARARVTGWTGRVRRAPDSRRTAPVDRRNDLASCLRCRTCATDIRTAARSAAACRRHVASRTGRSSGSPCPAFGALVAEPLFLLADSAIVGHLGTPQLAGLGVAGALLATAVSAVRLPRLRHHRRGRPPGRCRRPARRRRPGHRRHLAGARPSACCSPRRRPARRRAAGRGVRTPSAAVAAYALTYLRVSLARPAGDARRARRDRRAARAAGHPHPAGRRRRRRGRSTSCSTSSSSTGSTWASPARRSARCSPRSGWRPRSSPSSLRGARRARRSAAAGPARHPGGRPAPGVPLVVRTVTLRAALLLTTYVATVDRHRGGRRAPGRLHHLALPVAGARRVAIAGQAIVGRYLGAGDAEGARVATRRMVRVGRRGRCAARAGGRRAARARSSRCSPPTPRCGTLLDVGARRRRARQPVCGVVFALDGVLIGAGDGRYLAWAGVSTLASFVPLALLVLAADGGLVALWWAFDAFMLARLVDPRRALARRALAGHRRRVCRAGRDAPRSATRPGSRVQSPVDAVARPRGAGRHGRCAGRTPRSCAAPAPGCRWCPRLAGAW